MFSNQNLNMDTTFCYGDAQHVDTPSSYFIVDLWPHPGRGEQQLSPLRHKLGEVGDVVRADCVVLVSGSRVPGWWSWALLVWASPAWPTSCWGETRTTRTRSTTSSASPSAPPPSRPGGASRRTPVPSPDHGSDMETMSVQPSHSKQNNPITSITKKYPVTP